MKKNTPALPDFFSLTEKEKTQDYVRIDVLEISLKGSPFKLDKLYIDEKSFIPERLKVILKEKYLDKNLQVRRFVFGSRFVSRDFAFNIIK